MRVLQNKEFPEYEIVCPRCKALLAYTDADVQGKRYPVIVCAVCRDEIAITQTEKVAISETYKLPEQK